VWWQRGQAYHGGVQAASDVLGLLFFMLLFPSMRALFRSLFTFPVSLLGMGSGLLTASAAWLACASLPLHCACNLLPVPVCLS
jgi:hypothetical protein